MLGGFIFYMRCKCDTGKVSLGYTWYIIQASEEHYGNCVCLIFLFSVLMDTLALEASFRHKSGVAVKKDVLSSHSF